jgi:hypothetical protein
MAVLSILMAITLRMAKNVNKTVEMCTPSGFSLRLLLLYLTTMYTAKIVDHLNGY